MKTRALVTGLIAAVGLAAGANGQTTTGSSSVTCTIEYMGDTALFAGGVASDHDGIVEPGEGALLRVNVAYSNRNGTGSFSPASGTNTSGTVRGLGGGFVDLVGTGGTVGSWDRTTNYGVGVDGNGDPENWHYGVANSFQATTHPDTVGPFSSGGYWEIPGGNGTVAGSNLINVQFGQLPPGPSAINATGPTLNGMFTVVWTPDSYTARIVSFAPAASAAAGAFPFSVLFKTPTNSVVSAFTLQNSMVGSTGIAVAPAPASLALLGLGGLVVARRRRR